MLIPIYNVYFFFKVFIEICYCFGKTSLLDRIMVVVFNAPYVIYLGLSPETEYKGPLYQKSGTQQEKNENAETEYQTVKS